MTKNQTAETMSMLQTWTRGSPVLVCEKWSLSLKRMFHVHSSRLYFKGTWRPRVASPRQKRCTSLRWTIVTEMFRYLAGSGRVPWMPTPLQRIWYQHAVGHGLLIQFGVLREVGGIPRPRHGLEDAALGVRLRAAGHSIVPLHSLECGDVPSNLRELLRQRSTWIRGPLYASNMAIESQRLPMLCRGSSTVFSGRSGSQSSSLL